MDSPAAPVAALARLLLAAALAAALPALAADTYKWVDERGVVTYSNTPPPATGKQPNKVDAVGDRMTVYTPDERLRQAIQSAGERKANPAATSPVVSRTTRTVPNAAAQQSAYERCVAQRRTDCDTLRQPASTYDSYASEYGNPWYITPPIHHLVGAPAVPFRILDPGPSTVVGANPLPNANAGKAPLSNANAGLPQDTTTDSAPPRSTPGGGRRSR